MDQDTPKAWRAMQFRLKAESLQFADVFDALSSARPYKEAFPIDRCLKILIDSRGKHFDPRVLDAFLRRKEEAIRVREEYVDFERDDIL